jgi:peptidyl-dipeptidase Dcp
MTLPTTARGFHMNFGIRLGALVLMGGCAANPVIAQTAVNPFAAASTLPFQAPRFDIIKDRDYLPAFDEGIRQELAEVEAIANDPGAPTFDNTIVALERSGRMLDRVNATFSAVVQANSNPELSKVQTTEAPKLAAQEDVIDLNPRLFARVKSVYDHRGTLNVDSESLQLLATTYQRFVHAGANLSDHDKSRMMQINEELAELSTSFRQKLVAGTKAGALVVDDAAALAGLSDTSRANAAQAATERHLAGKWVIPLQNTTQQPSLTDLSVRATRERLFENRWDATERGDANDTRPVIMRMAQLRAEKAKLLGYPNYAAYVLYDQMAKTPDAVLKFLGQLVSPTAGKAAAEAKLIQAAIDKDGAHFDLKPWDWQRYAAQVQMERYDLDENELKPYFELHTVLEKGVFYAAEQLYGITFRRRTDIPVYQSDVMVYEVFDKDRSSLGLAYFDYFKRDNKEGGAWDDNFIQQSHLLGTKPVIYNVANFTKPAPGQPALISFDDVTTMFHEFGHGLHGLFGNGNYASLSGTNVARDFVEFPSQFNEHWALYPAVLKHYAINRTTGHVIPDALVDKIKKAQTWGQGYQLGELLAASELDMKWHMLPKSATVQDADSFEASALKDTHTDFVNVPTRYRSSYFMHIWGNDYAAGYYAYQWSVMLDDDAFAWFTAHGGLTRANGQRFRDMILSRGHSEDYGPMFRAFYGKDPDIGPMLEHHGLTPN